MAVSNLKFFQLNTDFTKASTLLLEKYFQEQEIDVALIQDIYCEKFGLAQNYQPPDFLGYNVFYYKEDAIPKTAIYIRRSIKTTYMPHVSNSHCVTCVVHLDNAKNIVISTAYCPPPDISPLIRIDSLFKNLSSIQIQNLILCGDFNSHSSLWSNCSKNDSKGDELEMVFLQNDLTVLNDVDSPPTFANTRGGVSWIDISVAGNKLSDSISSWQVSNTETLSFHKIITFTLEVVPSITKTARFNFKKTNWEIFNQNLETSFGKYGITTESISCSTPASIDKIANDLSVSLKETIISNVPSTVNYKNRTLVSWWNSEISRLRKEVNKARRIKQGNPSENNTEVYKNLRNKYKYTIRKSKYNDFSSYCSSAQSPWDLLHKLTSRTQNTTSPTLLKDDDTYTSCDTDTCNYLLEKWFPDDDETTDEAFHREIRNTVNLYLSRPFSSLPEISNSELDIINTISPLKSPGWDLVRAIVLQNLSCRNRDTIRSFFNLCIKFSYFPKAWKFGMGKTLPKPDKKDESNYKSFRCITLVSVLGKWFEKILMKRLMWDALQHNRISKSQFGFIPGRSCENAICNLTAIIENAFAENRFVLVIFLDISGAFDCTWHPSILKSFIDKGYDPAYVHLIKSYLSDRILQLNLNCSSSQKLLSRSCPQGGGLSPFIWDTDFDDALDIPTVDPEVLSIIQECTYTDASSQAFADDSQVAIVSDTLHAIQLIGNDILEKLHKHSKIKKSTYSAEKTQGVIFAKRKIPFSLDLRLNNQPIKISEKGKLLGVTMDCRLSWKPHIEDQITKAKRLLFLLNKCCKLKWGLTSKVSREIWTGVVEQILLYASPAWSSCISKKWALQKLESVQRLAAIKMIRAFKSVSYEASLVLSGLTPIAYRLHEKSLAYAAKHPNHFHSNTFPSHVSSIKTLAGEYSIDLNNFETFNKSPSDIAPYDKITAKTSLDIRPFYPLRRLNEINIYTDGSKSSLGTGCAFVMFPPMPHHLYHKQLKLDSENSVYQAELVAILHSLKHIMDLPCKLLSSCKITIFTDSQSSINEISDNDSQNRIVREIHKYVQLFSSFTNLSFVWCKGHSDIIGNEMADYFARKSVISSVSSKIYKLPISHLKSKVKRKAEENWLNRWRNSTNARTTFSFFPHTQIPDHIRKKEHNFKITQVLTGHCRLNMYLNSIGVESNPACKCEEYVETIDHYLFDCKLEHVNRTNTMIKACFEQGISFPPTRTQIMENKFLFESFCTFVNRSSRLEFPK